MALNGHDRGWESLFCVARLNIVNCPYSAGSAGDKPPHSFIWTADKVTKNMQCGRYYTASAIERYYSVDYTTYSGIETEGNNSLHRRSGPEPGQH